ncbi:ABC transporter ATP-binding protein [Heyndrickxia shackletonii]|uniref:ABC transporter ATP-binding protein n=1 Tax=Heyndrickxia shackletonii TaxID=157838 RepID=A0A0Q3WSU5_9BACI|nr:ABC transporter ATP-binding protein [Heyndrickxia shackletonii]KQL51077.1 ABC transporter ATP-binding protein [Heyndrickxia shackletonii]MBB2479848.1 ABC transporter ATP-binding protein [Bacillus sp. APMAM]NEZ00708.1 ABC transporter ATP-binding protein [Heyndrickxia shackletonii]RTZ56698.1 ABC transporter ATP-binding protein [Bacillus sp. SAJ1]
MEYIIDIQGIKKSYKKRKSKEIIQAVKGVSFQVKRGEVVGLLGPNGAGKTTTIKMMCGLLLPNEGTIKINGIDIGKQRLKALRHISTVLEGNRNLYWRLTVRENLEYFSGNRGLSKKAVSAQIDELLERLNLTHKANEMVNSLSRGMQQKVSIAVALLSNTEIIFLDEPTLGLDIETSYEVRKLLKDIAKEYNKTILLSSHDMPVVQEICERVIIINEGRIVSDERVSDLLELFDTKAYSFTVNSVLSDKNLKEIQNHFMAELELNDGMQSVITVTITHSEDFYKVINLFEEMNIEIDKVDRSIIDFEQVFLKIVKGEMKREIAATV